MEDKMKTKKIVVLAASVLFVFAVALTVQAGIPGMGPGMSSFKALMDLDLTEAQKGQISDILNKYQAQQEDAWEKMQEVRDIMEPVLTASEFNEANIRQACEQVSPTIQNVVVLKAKIMNEIRGVLTAEQIKVLEEKRSERNDKMKKRKKFGKQFLNTWLQMPAE